MPMLSTVLSVISVVFTLNVVLAAIVVFFERRSPSSTWAWLFVLFFIPIIGFIIYLIFGRYTGKKKAFGPKIIRDMETLDGFAFKASCSDIMVNSYLMTHRKVKNT